MKHFFCFLAWLVPMAVSNQSVFAITPVKFGLPSLTNPNMQTEIRQTTQVRLEGYGNTWHRLNGLNRTDILFRDQKELKKLVRSLNVSGEALPMPSAIMNGMNDEIRIYLYKNHSSSPDMIWYFIRNGKAYYSPDLSLWTHEHYQKRQIFLICPTSRRRFEAIIRSIWKQAGRQGSIFSKQYAGGD